MPETMSFRDEIDYYHKERELKELIESDKTKVEFLEELVAVLFDKKDDETIKKTISKYKTEIKRLGASIPLHETELEEMHKDFEKARSKGDKEKKEPLPDYVNAQAKYMTKKINEFQKAEKVSIASKTKLKVVQNEVKRLLKQTERSTEVEGYLSFLSDLCMKLEKQADEDQTVMFDKDREALKEVDVLFGMMDRIKKGIPEPVEKEKE